MSKEQQEVDNVLLSNAIILAAKSHRGQLDKSGRPYILHPLRVMYFVGNIVPDDAEAQIVAVLHDAIEDTSVTLLALSQTYPKRVIDALDAISQRKGEQYFDYIRRCCENEVARMVKFEDLNDNMSPVRRFDGDEGLRERYKKALHLISEYQLPTILCPTYEVDNEWTRRCTLAMGHTSGHAWSVWKSG